MDEVLVSVVYRDGTESVVSTDVLDVLIATGRIKKFKREDGWVDIVEDKDQLRSYREDEQYSGPERRSPWQREDDRKK